jgi:hypothetical protein
MKSVLILILGLILTAAVVAPNANAQLPQLDPVAAKLAHALAHSKQKTVIVFDFWGPDEKLNRLGQYLAENLSAALTKPNLPFVVADRSKIAAACAAHGLAISAITDPDTAMWIASDLNARAVILGKLSIQNGKLMIETRSYQEEDLKQLAGFRSTALISKDMRLLLDREIPETSTSNGNSVPVSGKNGYAYPKCISCPAASYNDVAVHQKVQGTVILIAIIGTDGRAHEIAAIKTMPYGLTKNAMEAVSRWKFAPAVDSNGKPVAVRQTIEVSFHLY